MMDTREPITDTALVAAARRALSIETRALEALQPRIGAAFAAACRLCLDCGGRVIVTGIGKSGHVGQKIAATFASTGTPAFFVHPSEASHGDLGMVTRDDLILALSWSGETVELKPLITYSRRFAVPLIALTQYKVPAYPADALPPELAAIPAVKPGSRGLA